MLINTGRWSGPARRQQPARRDRGGDLPDRHLDGEPGTRTPRPRRHRGDRVRPRGPGRPGQHRIRRQRPTPPGEHHPDRLDPSAETPQPAAHRPGRPAQQLGDPPVPAPGGLRLQRRTDHRGGVRAPDQQQHRQQHMRRPAPGAPRPPRHDPNPPSGRGPSGPEPGPTRPARPHPGHANRPDRSRSSTPTVSVSTVSIAPPSATTRPSRTPGQGRQREGRGLPRPEDRHGGGADEPGQHDPPASMQICTLNDANQPYVVILSGGQHTCFETECHSSRASWCCSAPSERIVDGAGCRARTEEGGQLDRHEALHRFRRHRWNLLALTLQRTPLLPQPGQCGSGIASTHVPFHVLDLSDCSVKVVVSASAHCQFDELAWD